MDSKNSENTGVGIVETQTLKLPVGENGFELCRGGILQELDVAYETYGKLSPERDNVVLICHALTGDSHVAGRHHASDDKPGWWDNMVGPGKGIDTDYYFVVCPNILGGCKGTTGPSSINPATGKPYGSAFPPVTVTDMVNVQKLFLDQLGIERLAAVIGASLGGMQVLEWAIQYPENTERCICIATGVSLSSQALAFDAVARDAILSDPNWSGGDYYENENRPAWGLSHARKIGHITYLSPEIMAKKFGREKVEDCKGDPKGFRFEVESYLDHQGSKLVDRFDANSYLRITEAVDSYDLVQEHGSLQDAFEKVRSKFLVIALSSDWLFPPEQSLELTNALLTGGKRVSLCTLQAPYGHDAFLIDIEHLSEIVRAFLPWVSPAGKTEAKPGAIDAAQASRENQIIRGMVPKSAKRILDLGCGDGELLSLLSTDRDNTCDLGVDIDLHNVVTSIDRGHDVLQADLDHGLEDIPDNTYDCAILGSTLQVVRRPKVVLQEIVRVAREGIVTFPNFANWRNRVSLGIRGGMPKSQALPYEWYDTPNIHLTTLKDFIGLCRREDIDILEMICIPMNLPDRLLISIGLRNLGAARVLVRIARNTSG